MIRGDHIINDIAYGDAVRKIADAKGIGLAEARQEMSRMTFSQYCNLVNEAGSNIVPPSGNPIGPDSSPEKQNSPSKSPQNIKSIWPGQGAPVEVGMTVGLKDPNGKPMPGTVSQVDMSANGVKVKNPTTGQDEWVNTDNLEPYMVSTDNNYPDGDLQRLKELAGISENCSSGATGAGSIAIAPSAMGKMQKRQPTEEQKKEYVRKDPPKTIIGDTKSHQASGELSATLAANGKKTATRINNGMKK